MAHGNSELLNRKPGVLKCTQKFLVKEVILAKVIFSKLSRTQLGFWFPHLSYSFQ
jgi:hypothetical protein